MNQYSIVRSSFGRKRAKMNDKYINATDAIRKGSKNLVIDYIKSSKKIKEYFDMNAIEELIKQHMDDVVSEPLKLTALLTYAIWDQQFNK